MAKVQSSPFGRQRGMKDTLFKFLEEAILKPFSEVRNEDGSINEAVLIRVLSNLAVFKSLIDWKKENNDMQERDNVLDDMLSENNTYDEVEEICKQKMRIYMKIAEQSFPNLFDVERQLRWGQEDGTITEGYVEDMMGNVQP